MTATPIPTRPPLRRGFTLIEVLVVIGIIVLLAGILLPLVNRSRRQAQATKTAADLQTIAQGLEAFKADHGDYPEVDGDSTGAAILARNLYGGLGDGVLVAPTVDPDDPKDYDGATTYKPGDAVRSGGNTYVALVETTGDPVTDDRVWTEVAVNDGVDGPGMRLRAGGKKWGPYLSEGAVPVRGCSFIDGDGNAIVYFRANPGKLDTAQDDAYVAREDRTVSPPVVPQWDAMDGLGYFRRAGDDDAAGTKRIRAMFGDFNDDGAAKSADDETALATGAFVLWAAGPDGFYGPTDLGATPAETRKAVDKCDDITTFNQ